MANPLVCLREEITGNRSHHNMAIYHCGGKNNAVIGNCGQPVYTFKRCESNCLTWRINTQNHVCIVAMEEIQTSSMSSVSYSNKKLELNILISSNNFHFSASFDFTLLRHLHALQRNLQRNTM